MEMKITFRSPIILLNWNKPSLSPFCYYRDLTNGTTQVYYRTPLSGTTLKYTDTPTFSWTLTGEKKVISGYEAQRATCQFRGRSYEAWFTPQHPDLRWPELLWRPPWADTRATQHGWSPSAIMLKAHFKLF